MPERRTNAPDPPGQSKEIRNKGCQHDDKLKHVASPGGSELSLSSTAESKRRTRGKSRLPISSTDSSKGFSRWRLPSSKRGKQGVKQGSIKSSNNERSTPSSNGVQTRDPREDAETLDREEVISPNRQTTTPTSNIIVRYPGIGKIEHCTLGIEQGLDQYSRELLEFGKFSLIAPITNMTKASPLLCSGQSFMAPANVSMRGLEERLGAGCLD
jgi:hypothetical protein